MYEPSKEKDLELFEFMLQKLQDHVLEEHQLELVNLGFNDADFEYYKKNLCVKVNR